MTSIRRLVSTVDHWQRRTPTIAVPFGVVKKFGDDGVNQLVVGLGWYGFVAIYPLLLAVVATFGFIGAASLGHGIVNTLHQFPVVGEQFNPAEGSNSLHGSTVGLVVGLFGLVYGAQGVTQVAQEAMGRVWNVPGLDLPGFLPRLARSLLALVLIGGSFLVNAAVATVATGSGHPMWLRVLVIAAMLVMNSVLYLATFRTLTPRSIATRALVPGALVGGSGFTLLITVGSGLVQHQVRHSSATYGQFGVVIGLVGFLFLLAKISLYGAELNPVLDRHLWPRSLVTSDPTVADDLVLHDIAHAARRRKDQRIRVTFDDDPDRTDDGAGSMGPDTPGGPDGATTPGSAR